MICAKNMIDSSVYCHSHNIVFQKQIFIWTKKSRNIIELYFIFFIVLHFRCKYVCRFEWMYECVYVCSYSYYNTTKVNLECLINQDVKVDYRTKWLNAIFYFILLCESLEQKQEWWKTFPLIIPLGFDFYLCKYNMSYECRHDVSTFYYHTIMKRAFGYLRKILFVVQFWRR